MSSASGRCRLNCCAGDRRQTYCIIVCSELALRALLAKRKQRASCLGNLAQARILRVEFRKHIAIARLQDNADERAGLIRVLDHAFVVAILSAFVAMAIHFSRDFVSLLEVFREFSSVFANVARRLQQRLAEIDGEAHFSAEREAVRCKARGHRQRRAIRL